MFSIWANRNVRIAVIGLLVALLLLLAPACFLLADSGGVRCEKNSDSCDLIEINHYLNYAGEVALDQVIFWEYSPGLGRMVVRDWRTLKCLHQLPHRTSTGVYRACWHDSRDGNALRVVSARSAIETWTTYDAEQVNQEIVDRNQRRWLCPVLPKRGAP